MAQKKLIGIGRGLAGQDLKNFSQILRQNRCASGYQLVDESSGEVFKCPQILNSYVENRFSSM